MDIIDIIYILLFVSIWKLCSLGGWDFIKNWFSSIFVGSFLLMLLTTFWSNIRNTLENSVLSLKSFRIIILFYYTWKNQICINYRLSFSLSIVCFDFYKWNMFCICMASEYAIECVTYTNTNTFSWSATEWM